jgi:hypothetical protein
LEIDETPTFHGLRRTAAIDHTGIGVADVGRSARLLRRRFGVPGMRPVMQMPDNAGTDGVGYGFDYPVFSIDRYHPRRNSWRDKVAARFVARCSV